MLLKYKRPVRISSDPVFPNLVDLRAVFPKIKAPGPRFKHPSLEMSDLKKKMNANS